MDQFPVRKHIRMPEYDYSTPGYYFVTICSLANRPVFSNDMMQLTPVGEIASRCLEAIPDHLKEVAVDIFCVMPTHVHAIIIVKSVGPPYMAADRSKATLSRAVQQYKAAVSRLSKQPDIWQDGFYDHIIRNDADLAETRDYILHNPAKWQYRAECTQHP